MRTSPRHLSRLHFDFSGCKTSIEFDAQITQLSRLRDDGGQLLARCTPGSGVGNVVIGVLDARCGNGGLPAGVWILAFGGEGPRVLYRVFCSCGFALREQGAGKDAPCPGLVVADFLRLKNLKSPPDCSFLFGGRMRLFEGQIREPELSLSSGKSVACCGPDCQRLLVHFAAAQKISLLEQETSQTPHRVGRGVPIAFRLPGRERLFESVPRPRKVPLQTANRRDAVVG